MSIAKGVQRVSVKGSKGPIQAVQVPELCQAVLSGCLASNSKGGTSDWLVFFPIFILITPQRLMLRKREHHSLTAPLSHCRALIQLHAELLLSPSSSQAGVTILYLLLPGLLVIILTLHNSQFNWLSSVTIIFFWVVLSLH